MKRFFLFLISLVLFFNLWGQKGFYSTDSLISVGVTIIDGGDIKNSQFCRVNYGDRIVDYTPDQISEYGFDDRKFFSREILIDGLPRRVFLERVVDGGKSLYYYRARGITLFFVDVGDGFLLRLPKVDEESRRKFTEVLTELTQDCIYTKDFIGLVSYSKRSMTEFFQRYNQCRQSSFQRLRFGLSIGYSLGKLNLSDLTFLEFITAIPFSYQGGLNLGFFIDFPVFFTDFSIVFETSVSQTSVFHTGFFDGSEYFMSYHSTDIYSPLLVRYYLFDNIRLRPFFNFGGSVSFEASRKQKIYQAFFEESEITTIVLPYEPKYDKFKLGYSIGFGSEIKINFRNSIFLEARYAINFSRNPKTTQHINFGRSGFLFKASLNF